MSTSENNRKLGLRAAWAVLALALGWLAPVVTFASFVPDVCRMECCVAEGHCCCSPRHALVEGQIPDGRGRAGAAQLSRPCPNNCATPVSPGSASARAAERAPLHHFDGAEDGLPPPPGQTVIHHSLQNRPSSPRAPPTLS
jgi:hypothetical protein